MRSKGEVVVTPLSDLKNMKLSQKQRILNYLRAKKSGAFNHELNNICFRYSARINDLRREGFEIISEPVDIHQGLWRYILIFDHQK